MIAPPLPSADGPTGEASRRQRRLKWPTREETASCLRLSIAVLAAFVTVYGLCNWLASLRSSRHHFYAQWELDFPFVPQLVYVYLSLNVLLVLPLFLLKLAEFKPLAYTMVSATAIAGVFFLAVPAELGFERPETVPGYEFVFSQIYRWLLPHNLVPSLHITYSTIGVLAITHKGSPALKAGFFSWLVLICISVVAIHQHHLIDVLTGILLALVCHRLIFVRPTRA